MSRLLPIAVALLLSGCGSVPPSSGRVEPTSHALATIGVPAVSPTPDPTPAVPSPTGYSLLTVNTEAGAFSVHLIKEDLVTVSVRTVTANTSDCRRDCPVQPLADYVREAGAFAGMNGTYLCPPDYPECSDKINSYAYAVYSSDQRKWLNERQLNGLNGLVTFAGGVPAFYRRSSTYSRIASTTPVTAGLSMYPLLLQDGGIVNFEAEQTPSHRARNTKGAIGVDRTHVYLALVIGATLVELAQVLQALGARHALNLDGGGTSAMHYDGAYKVGPGRLLPNAIVLTRP